MSGLLRRIRRPGAAAGDAQQPAAESPPDVDRPAVPAGVSLDELERRPSTRRRGGLRRRARYLSRARELMLRDLGGLIYESRRRGQPAAEALVGQKTERLAAVDSELRELHEHLGTARSDTVLREPGIGGSCPACGELHPSEARYCANCGNGLAGRERAQPTREEAATGAEVHAREEAPAGAEVRADRAPAAATDSPTRDELAADGEGTPGDAAAAAPSEQPTREEPAAANGRHAAEPVPSTKRAS